MLKVFKDLRQRAQRISLSQRLILGLVVVVAVIIFSGLPADIALWLQLEQQIWLRVHDTQSATQALYEAETTRMLRLAGLIAARPTLYDLLQQKNTAELETYLDNLQEESGNLDILQVYTPDLWVGDLLPGLPEPAAFLAGREPYFADFVSLEQPSRLFIVAVSQIQPSGIHNLEQGWVLLARQLQSEDMFILEEQTGLAQSLIIGEVRIATSLPAAPDGAFDPQSALQVVNTGQSRSTLASIQGEQYYIGLAPLFDSQGNLVVLSEVALAGGAIRRDMLGTMVISTGISLLVMLAGLIFVVWQARAITRPLLQLSQAAEQISQGNLEVPTPQDSGLPEIDRLAHQFDLARRQLRQTLAVTQRDMKHAERLLSSVRQGVVALDKDGRITFINPDAEEILGHKSENVLRHHYSHIFPPAPGETTGLQEILSQPAGESASQRVNIINGQGTPLLLAIKVSQLEGDLPDSNEPECVLVIRDVTEEEAVGRLRYNFLANVAHEFRTPLAGISATTELMVEESSTLTSDELLQLVETIRLSTLHLQTLVDNLLESTTIEAGVFQVHCYPISIEDVVQRAADMMAPLFSRRSQVLEISSSVEIPTLWADPNRLTQVLVNLLSNASKFSPMGGKIALVISNDSEWLTVAVLDSGPGLPAGRFADVFKRYVSTNQLHDTQYGIGLGLSVVKTIVEVHGGQVGAENRPEGGARVWFTIPIHPSEEIVNS